MLMELCQDGAVAVSRTWLSYSGPYSSFAVVVFDSLAYDGILRGYSSFSTNNGHKYGQSL